MNSTSNYHTKIDSKCRSISHHSSTKTLVDSTQAITSQNTPASVENIAVLDAGSRLGTDYLDLHLGLELNSKHDTSLQNNDIKPT